MMSEMLGTLVFYAVAFVILATALGVVTSKNLVHSALLMTACFIGVGVLFIWLSADFLGAMEFMLYCSHSGSNGCYADQASGRPSGQPVQPSEDHCTGTGYPFCAGDEYGNCIYSGSKWKLCISRYSKCFGGYDAEQVYFGF